LILILEIHSATSLACSHNTKKMLHWAIVILWCPIILAFPGGAPFQACTSMAPNHEGAAASSSPSPYTITCEQNADIVTSRCYSFLC